MVVIIVIIILLVLSLAIVPFFRQLMLDKEELMQNPINEKFRILLNIINERMMDNSGELTLFDDDPKLMNLMSPYRRNLLIQFFYSTGNLNITLKYKYFQVELQHKRQFTGLRNLDVFAQKDIANDFIESSEIAMKKHEINVGQTILQNRSNVQPSTSESDPTSLLSSLYESFTVDQKYSLVAFLYHISREGNISVSDFFSSSSVSHTIIFTGLDIDECRRLISTYDVECIVNNLSSLESADFPSIVLTCMLFLSEFKVKGDDVVSRMVSKMMEIFSQMGHSEDEVNQIAEKMIALQNMFMKP